MKVISILKQWLELWSISGIFAIFDSLEVNAYVIVIDIASSEIIYKDIFYSFQFVTRLYIRVGYQF